MYPNPCLSSALPLAAVAELELLLGKEEPLDAAAVSSFPDALLEDSKRNRPRPLLLVSGAPPAARNQRNQRGASPPTPMTPVFGEDDDDSFALRHQLLKELRLELAAMVDVALEGLLSREVDHSWHRARPGIHHQVERPFLDQLTRGFVDGVDGRRPGVRGVVYLGDSGTERKLVL